MKAKLLIGVVRGRQFCRVPRLRRIVWGLAAVGAAASALAAQPAYVRLDGLEAHPTRILARFKDTVVAQATSGTLNQLGSRVEWESKLVSGLAVLEDAATPGAASQASTDETAVRRRLTDRINALKLSGLFEYVEPDYVVLPTLTPTDSAFVDGTLWGLRNLGVSGADISATNAWDLTTGSTNVIVAVIDTGIRYTHRDLINQMWVNPGEIANNGIDDDSNGYVDDVHGINAINDSGDPMDVDDHGTHVAGTIGAAANDGNPTVGVAWKVRLMGCKFLTGFGGTTANGIKCIDYAVSKGARVLNNSWGSYGFSVALRDAITAAGQDGVLFVAAAGNDALDNDASFPHYPSSYPLDNIVAVAAVNRFDALADFSNFGLKSVDLGAPGEDIFSSFSGSDTDYSIISGTSMAAPHVSGVAALILSLYPSADLSELTGRLLGGAVPIPSLNRRTVTGGRLNAYKSLTISGNGILQATVTPPSGSVILSGSLQPIFVKVTDLFGVNFATVTGQVVGVTNLVFANNGTAPDVAANDDVYSAMFRVPASTGSVTMTVTATATNKVGATNQVFYTILPPPPNDYFTNATKVPAAGAVYLANNRFATLEPGEPTHAVATAAASLWWSWAPTSDTNVFIDTTGSAIDTVLAVYTGTAISNLQVVARTNDIGSRKQAYLSLPAQAGIAYRIAVASASTNSLGSIQLRIAPGGGRDLTPPAVFVSSPLSGLGVSNQVITLAGTAVDSPPNVTGVAEVFLSVNGAIATAAVGTTNWSAPALLQPGQNLLRVNAVDAAGNSSPTVTVQVYYLRNDPPNDIFANALPLTATPERVEAYSTNATKELNEPHHAGNAGGKSVWWQYQPPGDGVLVLNTTNSSFDTLLALYTGTIVTNLTQIAANDDAPGRVGGFSEIVQAVRANTVYHIAVDGYDGVSGHVSLNYSFTPATLYRLTIGETVNGTVAPPSGDYASNSVVMLSASPAANYKFSAWGGDVVSSQNPLSVVINADMTLSAAFEPVAFTDGFESGNLQQLPWTTSGSTPWIVTNQSVAAGLWAARSGAMTNNEVSQQVSSLILTTNFQAGNVSFNYRVSSEPGWDYLKFSVNGVEVQRWSGEAGWATFVFPITAGTHTLRWDYIKDPFGSDGLDAAFLDNVLLPFGLPIDETTPAVLQIVRLPNGSLVLEVQGQPGREYLIQASTNLTGWTTIATEVASGGVIQFTDPDTGTNPVRFYRAVAQVP